MQSSDTKINDLVTNIMTFMQKIAQDEKLPLSWLKGGLKTTFKSPLSYL